MDFRPFLIAWMMLAYSYRNGLIPSALKHTIPRLQKSFPLYGSLNLVTCNPIIHS